MNKLSSILGAAAVIAIAVVFILQFNPTSGKNAKVDSGPLCAVEVRGSCISTSAFWAAYRFVGSNSDQNQLKGMGLRKIVAEGLVEQWLLNQDAKRLGITVSEEDVSREVFAGRVHVSVPAAKMRQLGYQFRLGDDLLRVIPVKSGRTKQFDEKTYNKNVRNFAKMSPIEFREYQRAELVAARMRDVVRARVRVGENEAFEQFSREKSTATLEYARFERRFYADIAVDTSQKAVDAWATLNGEEIGKVWEARKAQILPECRLVRELAITSEETSSEDDKAAARKKIERALERVQKGEDFADVAKAMSDAPSAPQGGELGCAPKGKLPKPVEDEIWKLGAGKVSGVIKTEAGFVILKVEQIAKDADAEKLGKARVARELFLAHEADRLATEAAKSVQAAVKGGKSLKDAIQAHLDELAARTAPKEDEKKDDKKKDKKADEKKADEKKDEKKADEDRPPLTALNHPNRPTLETTLPFKVTDDPIPGTKAASDVAKMAFGLEKPGEAPNDIIAIESGFVVAALKEKTPASKEQWEKDREFYIGAMRAAKQNDALIAYVKRLQATIGNEIVYKPITEEPKAGAPGEEAPQPVGDPGDD